MAPRRENRRRPEQEVRDRRLAYQQAFDRERPGTRVLLEDLAEFCFAHESTMHVDPRAHAMQEGRREVWLRIQHHLNLNDQEFWALYRTGGASE